VPINLSKIGQSEVLAGARPG